MPIEEPPWNCPVVALDGPSASGKSTLARALAKALNWFYLGSGDWYRALTWVALRKGVDPSSPQALLDTLSSIQVLGHPDGSMDVDGRILDAELRAPRIDQAVCDVADHGAVREALNSRMRGFRSAPEVKGIVADGRDAGSVIFPDACLKVFIDAGVDARANRRLVQVEASGVDTTIADVRRALEERDSRDAARGASAPRPSPGGKVLDNSNLTVEEATGRLLSWVSPLLKEDPTTLS